MHEDGCRGVLRPKQGDEESRQREVWPGIAEPKGMRRGETSRKEESEPK